MDELGKNGAGLQFCGPAPSLPLPTIVLNLTTCRMMKFFINALSEDTFKLDDKSRAT